MQFSSICPIDRALSSSTIADQSGHGNDASHSSKPQHHWNLTIRLFWVISRTYYQHDLIMMLMMAMMKIGEGKFAFGGWQLKIALIFFLF